MATYLELLAEKRALDARIEAARAEAAHEALATARAAIAEFGFTPDDLFGKPRQAKAAKASRGKRKTSQDAADATATAAHNNFDLFGN